METCSIHSEAQRKIAQGDTGAVEFAQWLFAWKCLHLATQRAREALLERSSSSTFCDSRRGEGLWPLAQWLFAWKCLHLATQRGSRSSSSTFLVFRTRGGPMATRAAAFCLEMLTFGHPERVPQLLRHAAGRQRTRRGPMATGPAAFCLEMLRFGHPERVPQLLRHAAGRQRYFSSWKHPGSS